MIHQDAHSTAQAAPGRCPPTQVRRGQVTHSCCPPASQKAVGEEAWHHPGLPAALPLLLQVKLPPHVRMGSPAVTVYGTLCPDNHSRPVAENLSAHKASTPRARCTQDVVIWTQSTATSSAWTRTHEAYVLGPPDLRTQRPGPSVHPEVPHEGPKPRPRRD